MRSKLFSRTTMLLLMLLAQGTPVVSHSASMCGGTFLMAVEDGLEVFSIESKLFREDMVADPNRKNFLTAIMKNPDSIEVVFDENAVNIELYPELKNKRNVSAKNPILLIDSDSNLFLRMKFQPNYGTQELSITIPINYVSSVNHKIYDEESGRNMTNHVYNPRFRTNKGPINFKIPGSASGEISRPEMLSNAERYFRTHPAEYWGTNWAEMTPKERAQHDQWLRKNYPEHYYGEGKDSIYHEP